MAKNPADPFAEATEGDDPVPGVTDETPPPAEGGEEPPKPREEPPQDSRTAQPEEGEETPPEDETREQRRERESARERRLRRQRHLQEMREQNAYLTAELERLGQEVHQLKVGGGDSRLAILDSDMKRCSDEVAQADRIFAAAVQAQNGEDAAAAQRIRADAQRRLDQLTQERERLSQGLAQQRQAPPPPVPPQPGSAQANQNAARFRADHPWLQFRQDGYPLNIETGTAMTIDMTLRREGELDPRDPEYWVELDKRLKGALPHMFSADAADDDEEFEDEPPPPPPPRRLSQQAPSARTREGRGPPVGRSGRNAQSNRETVIPPEIVKELKEAGWWDDPKEREDALRYFREAGTIK